MLSSSLLQKQEDYKLHEIHCTLQEVRPFRLLQEYVCRKYISNSKSHKNPTQDMQRTGSKSTDYKDLKICCSVLCQIAYIFKCCKSNRKRNRGSWYLLLSSVQKSECKTEAEISFITSSQTGVISIAACTASAP